MGEIQGFSHVSLSVRDRDKSAQFYTDVFGFEIFEYFSEELYDETVMLHRPSGAILCLQQHRTNRGEPADPTRTGGDHVAFRVATRAELDSWVERLAGLGVRHSPIVDKRYGSVLCLRDPDEFQLEIFFSDNHP